MKSAAPRPGARPVSRSHARRDADPALVDFERALATVLRLLAHRSRVGDIARRSGHDLPPASWSLLEHLDGLGTMRVSEIAACHGVDISSVTPRLKSLESAGLVVRDTLATDARVSLIRITPYGKQALESVHAARREILARALAEVAPSRIATTSKVLEGIATVLGETE